jgi:hypothetical protein
MSEGVSLSDELTDDQWLAEIDRLGMSRGYYEPVGPRHGALFLDESFNVLLVSFDTITSARAGSASGIPHGMFQAELRGWSHLSVLAKSPTWFRDPSVYGYFDRLIDDGFFEDFDHVIFYGAGVGAYAASAFSVAAPGATVIAVAPQATLDPAIAGWDDRFVHMRRTDFGDRYGYAPDMVEAANQVFVVFDPHVELDAMHASLFRGPQIEHIRLRHAGPGIAAEVQGMNVLGPLFEKAAAGTLRSVDFYKALRKRRDYMPYLRNLLNRVHIEDRYYLTAMLCRAVLNTRRSQRFRHHLEVAEHRLIDHGGRLPPPLSQRRAQRRQRPTALK